MPFDNDTLRSRKKPFVGFRCPECAKNLSCKKLGDWKGGIFGFLFCSSHRYPIIWGIPIFLKQAPVAFLMALVDERRFEDSLVFALACSIPRKAGSFHERRAWARRILPNCAATFKTALLMLPKSWQNFFRDRFSNPSFQHVHRAVRACANGKTGPLLDLGCGTAPLAYALARTRQRTRVVSLDINFYLLYFARRFFQADSLYVCADARQRLPFPSKSFGGIICCGVSEAIRNLNQLFCECRRLLNSFGFLCWQP